jgi:hypothetical protein
VGAPRNGSPISDYGFQLDLAEQLDA